MNDYLLMPPTRDDAVKVWLSRCVMISRDRSSSVRLLMLSLQMLLTGEMLVGGNGSLLIYFMQ